MKTCPNCKFSVGKDDLKCPKCGMSFDETSGATAILPQEKERQKARIADSPSIHSTESADGARFSAGTILADRYRIVSLLGRGGMGEVYKAEDLKLKQIVALKFLPEALALDGAALTRFQNEVRITRQISHPNVCRVYDIGEADGMHFLSMEYIDGEDLSLLLRRIGRLPGDKANEIARQICAGLAAAHDNNVLHRDLKPANIMIDGRGKARVTDFGVAVVAKELLGREAMSGTPAYMAPEQLKGKEVTQKSDIYSLGLVLYELFTGKPVYSSENLNDLMKLHESSTPPSPASLVEHLDPVVERVIMRCLEKEPGRRPASAIQVAAAMPGGDPLAAALAAGETPSPEMVAASGEKTGLRPAVAVAMLAAIIAGLVISLFIGNKVNWKAQLLHENSPDQLTHEAEDIIKRLGYTEKPVGKASGLSSDFGLQRYLEQKTQSGNRFNQFIKSRPGPLYFWYRQSSKDLESRLIDNFGWVSEFDPPNEEFGMISIQLDPAGRLSYFKAKPPQVDEPSIEPTAPDWAPLFAAAGLEQAALKSAESKWSPPSAFDTRAAWTGTYPDQPDVPIRIEAAAYSGKPVYFNIIMPWQTPEVTKGFQPTIGRNIGTVIALTLIIGLIVGALLLARKNLRQGRGDRRGAARVSLFVVAITILAWLFGADHTFTPGEIGRLFFLAIPQSLFLAAIVWLFYVALEPYVRRRWPETIISWSRVLSGSLRDPLVGRDVLIAVLSAITITVLGQLQELTILSTGSVPQFSRIPAWLTPRQLVAAGILSNINGAIFVALLMFFFIFLLRVVTRRQWLTALLFVSVFSLPNILGQGDPLVVATFNILVNGITAIICLRFGLLTLAASLFVGGLIANVPIMTDFSAWYAGYTIFGLAVVLALAGWAFHASLGGQKLIAGNFLDE